MNNNRLINIEIQVVRYEHWDKRQLFYLSKMYTETARRGEDYDTLPSCISIAILDFNLTDCEEYYHCYKLRDEKGRIFSDDISIYILELKKTLGKESVLDDWIRLFKAQTEEDLNMIHTSNIGIREAIKDLKTFGLTGILREEYEYRLKVKRDARARDAYVRKEGIAIGRKEGILEMLEDLGEISDELRESISKQMDLEILRKWHRIAAKAETVEEFIQKM